MNFRPSKGASDSDPREGREQVSREVSANETEQAGDVVLPRNQAGDEEQSYDSFSQRREFSPSSFQPRLRPERAATRDSAKSESPCINAPRSMSLPASSGLLFIGASLTSSCAQSRGANLVCGGMLSTLPARRVLSRSCPAHGALHRTGRNPSSSPSGTRSAEGGSCDTTEQIRGSRRSPAGGNT